MPSCTLVSITGGVASCKWSGIPEPSSWDYIAVSEPGDNDDYICYSYNEEETAAGCADVDCSGDCSPGTQYVIRYFNRSTQIVCESAPFVWSDEMASGCIAAAVAAAAAAPAAAVAAAPPAPVNPDKTSCTLVSITGGVASCKWSGIPGPTESDFIAVSEPKDNGNYVYYSYNEKGTTAGFADVDCSGGYATPGTQYVIRYFNQHSQKVCDSAPFIWSDKMGDSGDAPALAAPVVPDGPPTPLARTKLVPFLVVSNVLFFSGFPMLLYYSYGRAECSTGPPNLAYGFLLLMVVFLTMGEICISRGLQQPGSYQALQGGYQELEQSESWKIFDEAYRHVFTRSIFEAKLDHYIFLGLFGRLELSDGNSDALQPGQVRACEVDGSIGEAPWASMSHMENITLSQAFLFLAVFSLLVQGFFALRGIIQIRNLTAVERELDQEPNVAVFADKLLKVTEGYVIAAEVAEGVGANVLCRLLEQATEAAESRRVKAGVDAFNSMSTQLDPSGPQEDVTAGTYEDAMAGTWKFMEDNLQPYRDMVKKGREEGDEETALYWEAYIKQTEAGIEESKQNYEKGLEPMQDYYGTTNMSEVATMQETVLKKTRGDEVVIRSVFNKVLCEAAPSLFLLTAFIDATIDDLTDIAKIKVIFSFSLSVFTCLSKAAKCFKAAKDPIKKQIMFRKAWKVILLGIAIMGITAASVFRFVGVLKGAVW